MGGLRRASAVASGAVVAGLLLSGGALGAARTGTPGNDTLVGTQQADRLDGQGGDDLLRGLAGNDVYRFGTGFGVDTLVEQASHRVKATVRKRGKKRQVWRTVPGGADTVDFSQYGDGGVFVSLIPQAGPENNLARGAMFDGVDFGASPVENVVGTPSDDFLVGGGGENVLNGGAGGADYLVDFGGYEGDSVVPALPASDDVFAAGNARDTRVEDLGGRDVLDLKPLRSTEVVASREDVLGSGTASDLVICWSDCGGRLVVVAHFGAGAMERIVFADKTVDAGDLPLAGNAVQAAERPPAGVASSAASGDLLRALRERRGRR